MIELPACFFEAHWQRTFYVFQQTISGVRPGSCEKGPETDTYGSDRGYGTQLLWVCKQFYREGAPIFYGMNIFHVETARALLPFLIDRTHRSREHLAAISLPFPDERWTPGPTMFGRVLDWQGQPTYLQDLTMGSAWQWIVDGFFNDTVRSLPGLKLLDLRVLVERYQRGDYEYNKRYRWNPGLGYRLADFYDVASLNMLHDLDIVRFSKRNTFRAVKKIRGKWEDLEELYLHDAANDEDEPYNPPAGDPGHVSREELLALEGNYEFIYTLSPAQKRTISLRRVVYTPAQYDHCTRGTRRPTAGKIERLADELHAKNPSGRAPVAEIQQPLTAAHGPEPVAAGRARPSRQPASQNIRHLREVVEFRKTPAPEDDTAAGKDETPDGVVRLAVQDCFLVPLSENQKKMVRRAGPSKPLEDPWPAVMEPVIPRTPFKD